MWRAAFVCRAALERRAALSHGERSSGRALRSERPFKTTHLSRRKGVFASGTLGAEPTYDVADLRSTWSFLVGALTGVAVTVGLVVAAFVLSPLDVRLSGAAESQEVQVALAPLEPRDVVGAEGTCPTLPVTTPPWAPDEEAIKHALHLAKPSPALDRRIRFWADVWGKHPTHVYVFADRRRPSLRHAVVDCRDLFPPGSDPVAAEKACDRRLIEKKREIVKALAAARHRPTPQLRRALDNDRALIRTAHENVFVIEGKADALEQAVSRAAPHLDRLEKIFATVGVPPELTRLSFVESLFQPDVVSHAGAAGAFQFVPNTGREYLMIADGVDERLDPERAGWASARYLKQLHKRFDDWGLALTAYNTGPTRMRRLVKRHKTRDIGALADMKTERAFGFDGQNYYAQLAAVVRITESLEPLEVPLSRQVVKLPEPMLLSEIARCTHTRAEDIAQLNPALTEPIVELKRPVPAGYHLNLPPEARALSVEEPKPNLPEQPS